MSKRNKKRRKKYQPQESKPVIHHFTAEAEISKIKRKRFVFWTILVIASFILLLLLLAWLIL